MKNDYNPKIQAVARLSKGEEAENVYKWALCDYFFQQNRTIS